MTEDLPDYIRIVNGRHRHDALEHAEREWESAQREEYWKGVRNKKAKDARAKRSTVKVSKEESARCTLENLVKRDGAFCYVCGEEDRPKLVRDHLVPISKYGGKDYFCNMAVICRSCNSFKRDRSVRDLHRLHERNKDKEYGEKYLILCKALIDKLWQMEWYMGEFEEPFQEEVSALFWSSGDFIGATLDSGWEPGELM